MILPIRPGAPLYQAQLQALALDMWRDAELVVQSRWDDFLEADYGSRPGAFAACRGHRSRRVERTGEVHMLTPKVIEITRESAHAEKAGPVTSGSRRAR
jgi:hypothetical protein